MGDMVNDPAVRLDEYFGVTRRLLPHVAELLTDFDELGSNPDLVGAWLAERGLGAGARVLDLGCGKGAVSIALCRQLGCKVDGVDAYAPFVAEADKRVEELGIVGLCDFQVGDIKERVGTAADYDAVLYLGIGGVLGSMAECIAALRRCVRPEGVMVLDDAYRLSAALDFPGYEHLRGRADTLAQLVVHGDRLLAEHLTPREAVAAQNRQYQAWIERRGRKLTAREPGLAADIAAFIEKERKECSLLECDVQCAMWLLQRASRTS
jgi:2-polyprenyl-3-methyl-5-hydroxy-6-metoxy-1,4-benzoquinol methylase